ncbi:unnamed protein product [Adineta ricciae]|uniref:Uncharacterized protein n=1 Tax=Adineta ricciae TaxID=249248 RepID=A0A814NK66_ADIRI|nr:unnamed protein product [Adineta ricciae]CAF1224587.1 unnamed protein product [Adineta ricciae]
MKHTFYKYKQRLNAFIITYDCKSLRFNATKQNIQRVFPDYFHIRCFRSVPLNDSRVHTSSNLIAKKVSSNLLSFIDLWTYEIAKYSTSNELQWSFIFEDDVNFVPPSNFSLKSYINTIEQLMDHPEIQSKHGFFYLGICAPTFSNKTGPLTNKESNNTLVSRKGYGWCSHGMGITTKRARDFWFHMSSYRPSPEGGIDLCLRQYSIRSKNEYYILGSNVHWPSNTGHFGIAYQDRKRFRSGMN